MPKRNLLTVVLLISLAANGALFYLWWSERSTVAESRRYVGFVMDSLGTSLTFPQPPPGPEGRDSVYWQWVATTARLQSRRWQDAVQHWRDRRGSLLDVEDEAMLQRVGLTDPAGQLRDSLMAHPEVIPFVPVLGGAMAFVPSEIVLLPPPYVFAWAEDGHVGGPVLLRYDAEPGVVRWKAVWSASE